MDFRIILNASGTQNFTYQLSEQDSADLSSNTIVFIVGFGILLLFMIFGIAASAFLCMTLKKDTFLWESESTSRLGSSRSCANDRRKSREKGDLERRHQETTQC